MTNTKIMEYKKPDIQKLKRERIARLKSRSLAVRQEVCPERARYYTKVYRENPSEPLIIVRAKALRETLQSMTISIGEDDLLAGDQAGSLRAAPIYPEYTVNWLEEEIDELEKRPGDAFFVKPEVKEELLDICRWWQGRTVHDRCLATLPEEIQEAYAMGILSATGNMTSGDGHILLDFPALLSRGVRGIREDVHAAGQNLKADDPEAPKKRIFYRGVEIALDGLIDFAERYADLAEKCAAAETSPERKEELAAIAENCRKVPLDPPATFREAVQAVWFAHLVSQIESNGHSFSLGRFDQYMYPFFKKDLERGILTEEDTLELLASLWIKMFGVTKIRPWDHTRFSGGGPTYQNLTIGGIDRNGHDATNSLSMLCLDSVSLTGLPQPNVSARFHLGTPTAFYRKCMEVIKLGFGMPALHNDELMVPSLMSHGVHLEDANDYAIIGCIEPVIPGKHGYRAAGMSFTNFTKIMEISLNGGVDPKTQSRLLSLPKSLDQYQSFEDAVEGYTRTMAHAVKVRITGEFIIDQAIEEMVPDAFCSAFVQDCIARGKTPKEGGAVYDMVTGPETGVVNVGNSLAALKKLVFEEKKLTPAELKEALDNDFSGEEGERIRQLLINGAPKFGNDDDYVDELADMAYRIFIRELAKYKNARAGRGPIGCVNYPCTATISGNVPSGMPVGATPDGRHAGEALSEGCSPFHGTDIKGPTAVINSMSKMPNILITGGNLLNQKISPSSLEGEGGLMKFEALIRTFFEKKGWHIQFNVISSETLREAQQKPEEYSDLVVRVAGYSALFNNLEPSTQEDIIVRTEHSLG